MNDWREDTDLNNFSWALWSFPDMDEENFKNTSCVITPQWDENDWSVVSQFMHKPTGTMIDRLTMQTYLEEVHDVRPISL